MKELFSTLERIEDLLDQIQKITQNQMTILLESSYMGESIEMVEDMADYKEQLTNQVELTEQIFQSLYSKYKATIETVEDKKHLKYLVDKIMKLKEVIIENEQKNMLVMQDLVRRSTERVELPKSPKKVADLYKSHHKQNNTLNE